MQALMMVAPIPFALFVSDRKLVQQCLAYALTVQVLIGLALVICLGDPKEFPLWLAHGLALVAGSLLLVASTVQSSGRERAATAARDP